MSASKKVQKSKSGFTALPSRELDEYKNSSYEKQEPDEKDTLCGIGSFTPKCLQRFSNPKVFLLNHSILGVLQGGFFTYLVGCLSTLEKRFAYESKVTGIIMIADEISPILLGLFLGYFGGKSHRPRIVAAGMLMAVLSCFVMSLPYFIYGPARHLTTKTFDTYHNGTKAEFCGPEGKSDECEKSPTLSAVSLLFFGNFLKGLGSLAFYTIGTSFLDDSVKKKNSPIYFGTLFALRLLGPALGFLLSSLCLQYYEDPFRDPDVGHFQRRGVYIKSLPLRNAANGVSTRTKLGKRSQATDDPGFSQKDPRWVGAWWLGFIVLGVAIFIFTIPMLLFPRRFPGKKLPPSLRNKKQEQKQQETPLQQLKGMGKAMKRISKNPILMCHYLGGVLRLNGVVGYYVLLPKYMEMQFRQSASKASLYSGPASIIGMQLGILLGGLAIRRCKPRPRILTGGIICTEGFSCLALVICMLITCPMLQLIGATQAEGQPVVSLQNDCNSDCMCTTKVYTPVCGPDGKSTYFSPCFAGCTGFNKTDNKQVFTECKCVFDYAGNLTTSEAEKDYCDADCQWLVTYVVILSLGKLISSTARVANTIVVLRCVDPDDKSIALGALSGVFSLLAFIPYPLIYGALTDASCLIWEKSCGKTGNCWVYDVNKFRFLLHGVSATFVFLGTLTDVFVCILSPRLKNLYDEDDDDASDEDARKEEEVIMNGGSLGLVKTGIPNGSLHSLNDTDEKFTTSGF